MIKDLSNTDKHRIVDTLHEAFSDYAISMKMPYDYWTNRWHAARIDYNLSFGYFIEDKPVGFILHGIDESKKGKSFFNMGTGVIPEHRGKKIIHQIYDYALPLLKQANCVCGLLEVLQNNKRAIHVYEKIGFNISNKLNSYKSAKHDSNIHCSYKLISEFDISKYIFLKHHELSWENNDKTIALNPSLFKCLELYDEQVLIGYAILKESNKSVPQFGIVNNNLDKFGLRLFKAIEEVMGDYKIININTKDNVLIDFLEDNNFPELINQFEMTLDLNQRK